MTRELPACSNCGSLFNARRINAKGFAALYMCDGCVVRIQAAEANYIRDRIYARQRDTTRDRSGYLEIRVAADPRRG